MTVRVARCVTVRESVLCCAALSKAAATSAPSGTVSYLVLFTSFVPESRIASGAMRRGHE